MVHHCDNIHKLLNLRSSNQWFNLQLLYSSLESFYMKILIWYSAAFQNILVSKIGEDPEYKNMLFYMFTFMDVFLDTNYAVFEKEFKIYLSELVKNSSYSKADSDEYLNSINKLDFKVLLNFLNEMALYFRSKNFKQLDGPDEANLKNVFLMVTYFYRFVFRNFHMSLGLKENKNDVRLYVIRIQEYLASSLYNVSLNSIYNLDKNLKLLNELVNSNQINFKESTYNINSELKTMFDDLLEKKNALTNLSNMLNNLKLEYELIQENLKKSKSETEFIQKDLQSLSKTIDSNLKVLPNMVEDALFAFERKADESLGNAALTAFNMLDKNEMVLNDHFEKSNRYLEKIVRDNDVKIQEFINSKESELRNLADLQQSELRNLADLQKNELNKSFSDIKQEYTNFTFVFNQQQVNLLQSINILDVRVNELQKNLNETNANAKAVLDNIVNNSYTDYRQSIESMKSLKMNYQVMLNLVKFGVVLIVAIAAVLVYLILKLKEGGLL